ncbi:MAG: protein jag [Chloroflexi bacterium]|nr:protein jag [Chloroflexota bacterium]
MVEMGQAIEATGADIEAAVEAGLERLGVTRDAVEIEVLDEGSGGVFGLGARQARVRLTVKPALAPALPVESVPPAAEPAAVEDDEKGEAQIAQGVLYELLALMGMENVRIDVRRAEPAAGEGDPPLVLSVHGPDTDTLVGYRGKTLDALQRITRLIVSQELAGRTWLVVDVGGFKAQREKSLRSLARRLAEQVERTDRTVALEPMPPNERRIIHLTLRDHPHVTTQSVGEDDRRKVTIIPR